MYFVIGVFLVTLLDQITKIWVQINMELMESIPVIRGIFHITYIQNPNSAFGLLKFPNTAFVIIALLVILIIVFLLRKKIAQKNKLVFFSLIFILGGSLGNMIDRLRVGSVIDFLDFRIWPIFNVADSALNIGLFLLIIHFLIHKEDEVQGNQQED
jgi:signal peptidase II